MTTSNEPIAARLERRGPFSLQELDTIRPESKFDLVEIDGLYYNRHFLYRRRRLLYAKSVIYSAEASVALMSNELL